MVVIGLCGPPSSGKTTVAALLEVAGYAKVQISKDEEGAETALSGIMEKWQEPQVVWPIITRAEAAVFRRRPFFVLLSVRSPILLRWSRYREGAKEGKAETLEEFLRRQDDMEFSECDDDRSLWDDGDIEISNTGDITSLGKQLECLGLTPPPMKSVLSRPPWDAYFMRLAFLAATRSNCMKKRVGCIVVNQSKVVSTGYNGSPFGVLNCNDGGCVRCNNPSITQGKSLEICICMHAEANALLEAGRERSRGSHLFVTCAPCLGCAKLIVQSGVARVMYCLEYDLEGGAIDFLRQTNVEVVSFREAYPIISPLPYRPLLLPPPTKGDETRGGVTGMTSRV